MVSCSTTQKRGRTIFWHYFRIGFFAFPSWVFFPVLAPDLSKYMLSHVFPLGTLKITWQDPLFKMLQGRFGRLVRGLKKWICVARGPRATHGVFQSVVGRFQVKSMVKICRNLVKKCHQHPKSSDFAVIFQSFLWHLHEHAALIRRAWEVLEIAGTVIQIVQKRLNIMGISWGYWDGNSWDIYPTLSNHDGNFSL